MTDSGYGDFPSSNYAAAIKIIIFHVCFEEMENRS